MKDYVEYGPVPYDEDCQQVGTDDYNHEIARAECRVLRWQLRRMFGNEPLGASLQIKSNPHDFGSYLEVRCVYEDSMPEAEAYAFYVENNFPKNWDEKSKEFLDSWKKRILAKFFEPGFSTLILDEPVKNDFDVKTLLSENFNKEEIE